MSEHHLIHSRLRATLSDRPPLSLDEHQFIRDEAAAFHDELCGSTPVYPAPGLYTPEDEIYMELLCFQTALAEADSEAKATAFDAMHATARRLSPHHPVVLVEPESEVLRMFTPTDLCNYAAPHNPPALHSVPQAPPLRQPQCYGVEQIALSVARNYMAWYGNRARTFNHRRQLENDILATMSSRDNIDQACIRDTNIPLPPTRQIIFAIAHGIKLLRVRGGHTLEWNQFRDNHGNRLQ